MNGKVRDASYARSERGTHFCSLLMSRGNFASVPAILDVVRAGEAPGCRMGVWEEEESDAEGNREEAGS